MLISLKAELLFRWTLQERYDWYVRLQELAWLKNEEELMRKATNYVRAYNTKYHLKANEDEIKNAVEEVIDSIHQIVENVKKG